MPFMNSTRASFGGQGRKNTPWRAYQFSSHTFTTAGMNANSGPTLAQCQAAYSGVVWAQNTAYLNMVRSGIQLWTVPTTGWYRITAAGGKGGEGRSGNSGGGGAVISGTFYFSANTKLQIAVGEQGYPTYQTGGDTQGGGGGGMSAVAYENNTPIIVAGGGGGGGDGGGSGGGGLATVRGDGQTGGGAAYGGAGGGGWRDNGTSNSAGDGGTSFINGLARPSTTYTRTATTQGGFGGGASGNDGDGQKGAGGGGYGGGTGGSTTDNGGGSYNSGGNQINTAGANFNNGYVTITKLQDKK